MIREDSCRICISLIIKKATEKEVDTNEERKALIEKWSSKYPVLSEEDPFTEEELEYIRRNYNVRNITFLYS